MQLHTQMRPYEFMSEPRTLKRLLLAMLALYIAWQAQSRLSGPIISDGLILYGIAIVLFVVALRRVPVTRAAGGPWVEPAPTDAVLRSRKFLILFYLSILLTLLALITFVPSDLGGLAWTLHLLSVLSLILAFTARNRPVRPALSEAEGSRKPDRSWLVLALLMALALFVRTWQTDSIPEGLWFDEARIGIEARQIISDPNYRPVYIEFVERPAHFTYLTAIAFRIFGVGFSSLRLVPALFGVLNVLLAFLLIRRWLGTSGGLIAAALFAFMRYDMTFARIAFDGNNAAFFIMLVLFFLDRGLERKRLSDFTFAGIALGFGLAFYLSFRIFVSVLVVLGLLLLVAALWRDHAWARVKSYLPHLLFAAIGAFIVLSPVLEFAVRAPDTFFQRTSTASIFLRRDETDLSKALWSNTLKHIGMFNYQGDRNGRHNLPGEPMLDPMTGMLFVLGLSLAVYRWRELPNLVMLLVFAGMLQGGILSLDFEAPQALRSIGVMPALIYFATLPLAAVGAEWQRVMKNYRSRVPGPKSITAHRTWDLGFGILSFGLVMLLMVVAANNLSTYFNRQMRDPGVWAAHSIGETIAAKEMNRLAATHDFILTSLYAGHPTLRFIAPSVTNYQPWTVNDRLPLARDVPVNGPEELRAVALLFDPLLQASYDAARLYYPNASYREFKSPTGSARALYAVQLARDDLRLVQGVVARYFNGTTFEGVPVKEEVVPQINPDWTKAPPINGTFSAEFRGTLFAQTYGNYAFSVRVSPLPQTLPRSTPESLPTHALPPAGQAGQAGAGNAALLIDENPVSDAPVALAKGNHALRLRVSGGAHKVELWWQRPNATQWQPVPASVLFRPPVSNSGLLGAYYRSPDWSGPPDFMQVDPQVALYFHNIPLPRPYSVEWTGKIFAPVSGTYRIATESIDDSQVAINSRVIVSNPGRTTTEGVAQLAQGWNDIVIRFADKTSHTHVYLYWTPPNGPREIVPSRYLSPPMGQYPTATEIAALPKPLPLSEQPRGAPPVPAGSLTLTPLQIIGEPGTGPAQFQEPHAIAIGASGRIFVADTGNKRVQILDEHGKFIAELTGGEEEFVDPFALVIASSGELIVLDSEDGWLYQFDQDGQSLGRVAGPSAQFFHPRGLSIDAQDNLYVADTGGARIVKLTLNGQRLQVFGTKGTGKGQFMEPSHAALDTLGFLYATDVPNQRIEAFSAAGKFLFDFPIPMAGPYHGPHIVFAPDQTLLVTAPELHKLQRYARDGKLLNEWGGAGQQPGQFRLPTGITMDGDTLWIADTGNHRIQKWKIESNP